MAEETIDLSSVAAIARLKLTDDERERMKRDIEGILAQFSEINAIKGIDSAKEKSYVNEGENPMREDRSSPCAESEAILGLFTRRDGRLLVAPKSLD